MFYLIDDVNSSQLGRGTVAHLSLREALLDARRAQESLPALKVDFEGVYRVFTTSFRSSLSVAIMNYVSTSWWTFVLLISILMVST